MLSRWFSPPRGFRRVLLAATAVVASSAAAAAQPVPQTLDGVLTIVWGDPAPGAMGGDVRYRLHTADGRTIALQLGDLAGVATRYFRRRVTATGVLSAAANAANARTQDVLTVSALSSAEPAAASEPLAVLGTRKVIYLLARFSDDVAVPHAPSFYTNMTNPDTPPVGEPFPATLNGFFKRASYHQFSWAGDVGGVGGAGAPGGWLTLPHPKSYYAPCGFGAFCADLDLLGDDVYALAKAQGIDLTTYDNINFVFSNDLDCCAWGGGYYNAGDAKSYGATWASPGAQNTPLYVHELGHSLGLPHSGWAYWAYDSPWDTMSGGGVLNFMPCGSYFSRNTNATEQLYCSEPGAGLITAHQEHLGWVPTANIATVNPGSSTTVTVEASTLALTDAVKMIKICLQGQSCSGNPARYVTVEVRVKGLGTASQFDNAIPADGVIIHDVDTARPPISGPCFSNSYSGWAVPIDSTPGDFDGPPNCTFTFTGALFNAQFVVGQSHTNTAFGVGVTILSRSGSTFVIRVDNLGTPAISAQPSGQTILAGQTATLSVTAAGSVPLTYQWYQGLSGVTTSPIAGATNSSYTTTPRTTTALFWARVSNIVTSANSDAAEVTVAFTDNTLAATVSPIMAVHVTELRARIDQLRQRFGLALYAWARILAAAASTVQAADFTELRVALLQAYAAAGATVPAFTDPALTAGLSIKRAHIVELRDAVHALERR